MNASALMVDDWVLFSGEPKRVRSIAVSDDNRVERIYVFGNTCQVSTINDYIQPIPLTPEILENNGFEYNDENARYYPNCWQKNGILLRKRTFNGFFYMVTVDYNNQDTNCTPIIITYVHELQHLLKLCRIEQQIEL